MGFTVKHSFFEPITKHDAMLDQTGLNDNVDFRKILGDDMTSNNLDFYDLKKSKITHNESFNFLRPK